MNKIIDISKITLKSNRLLLRPWNLDDLDDFFEYASVDGVGQMAGWIPHENKEHSILILNMFINEKKTFAIEFNNKVIGSLGIEKYNESELPEFNEKVGAELGFVLSKDYWGMGIMPEAVQEVIRYLFNEMGLDFLVCCHFVDNPQSEKVQFKCGFKHYKLVKHETRYGISKDTWVSILHNPRI
ncbi:MAG: GNAT family N-acetyltransferase [Bacilli bacterium]